MSQQQQDQSVTIEFTPEEMAAAGQAEEIASLQAANADLRGRVTMFRALANRQARDLVVTRKALEDALRPTTEDPGPDDE